MTLKPVETGLYALLTGDSALMAIVTGGVHRSIAPEQSGHPHLTFHCVTRKQETLGVDNGYYAVDVVIRAVGVGDDQTNPDAAWARVDALIGGGAGTLTVAGRTVMGVNRLGDTFSYAEHSRGRTYQHCGGSFRFLIQ